MKKHPVVICSNKVNRYGFRVLASGIRLDAYSKNPIILYSHQRPNMHNPHITPVGKMHDIRLDASGQLVGNIEFDEDDEFAVKLEKKWEKGMLNAVSLKAEMITVSDAPEYLLEGQQYPTLTETLLEEISIEPVPGDSDAVSLRLHYQGQPAQIISLSNEAEFDPSKLFPTTKPTSDMKLIALAFAGQKLVTLAKDANEDQIAEAITQLVAKANESVELSAKLGEKDAEILKLKDQIKTVELQAQTDKATTLVDAAVAAKKITPAQKAEFVELAKTNFETVEKILGSMKGFTGVSKETPEPGADDKYIALSWDDLDQKGLLPGLKKDNPALFKEKFKAKFGKEPG